MTLQRVHAGSHPGSDGVGGVLLGGGLAAVFAVLLPAAMGLQAALRRWLGERT
jgi:hypothetical protein